MIVVCIYNVYPVTADGRTPQYAFTSRVDPFSGPPEFASEQSEIENSERRAEVPKDVGGLLIAHLRFKKSFGVAEFS